MVQKVRKKGYFAKRRRLRIILLLIVVALSILISAFIFKLVDSQGEKTSKSEQTTESDSENKKYQNFANEFENNSENKNRDLGSVTFKIKDFWNVVLKRILSINRSVLELESPVDVYTSAQELIDFSGGTLKAFNLETLLEHWELMKMLDIGEVKTLTEPEQVNHTIMVEAKLILDLRDYKLQIIVLGGLCEKYKTEYGDQAQGMVLFSHILAFINSFEENLFFLTMNKNIEKDYFNYWQSEIGNKLALVFLNKFQNIVLGLPLFMILNFITGSNTREMIKNGELNCGQYKPLLEQILNTDTFTKEQIDVIKGKFYKLFILLETQEIKNGATENEDEHKKIDAVYQLLQLLDDDLKNFLVIYKKLE